MLKSIIKSLLSIVGWEYRFGKLMPAAHIGIYHKEVTTREEGNSIIKDLISKDRPALIARIGLTELKLIINYLNYRNKARIDWQEPVKDQIWKHSGIFPPEDKFLEAYAKEFLNAIAATDIVGVWNNEGEHEVIRRFCPHAELIPLESIEPYFFESPWSQILKGKKVLVIHPFEDSIRYQYLNNRKKIFQNEDILPEFHLDTVKVVQTLTYNNAGFTNWIEAYESMKQDINNKNFDIAIIGAGGYGLPLGAYIKNMGKIAIHMGGATQILFGIKGKRWEDRSEFKKLFNTEWKYPEPSEKPEKAMIHEDGAYW